MNLNRQQTCLQVAANSRPLAISSVKRFKRFRNTSWNRLASFFKLETADKVIRNRDLIAAGIPKEDADGCIVHVHSLRHSFGTHLSMAGVSSRVAQAAMRHSDIKLTMGTYTDARLLYTASAIESLKSCEPLHQLATIVDKISPLLTIPTESKSRQQNEKTLQYTREMQGLR